MNLGFPPYLFFRGLILMSSPLMDKWGGLGRGHHATQVPNVTVICYSIVYTG